MIERFARCRTNIHGSTSVEADRAEIRIGIGSVTVGGAKFVRLVRLV